MDIESLCSGMSGENDDMIKAVMRDYAEMIYRIALSQLKNIYDAEDAFQEVFVRYIKSNKDFESDEHAKAWLIRVTLNCCKKLRGTAYFRHAAPFDELEEEPSDDGGIEKSEVYCAVMELPPKYRTIIHLFYYEDMPTAEIGRILKMKQSTVASQLHRARNILRQKLREEYDYE